MAAFALALYVAAPDLTVNWSEAQAAIVPTFTCGVAGFEPEPRDPRLAVSVSNVQCRSGAVVVQGIVPRMTSPGTPAIARQRRVAVYLTTPAVRLVELDFENVRVIGFGWDARPESTTRPR